MLAYLIPFLAYLAGSVSSAIIVCRLMGLPDPRSSGSNNPGATNVLRIGGKKAAIITLIGDVLKGTLPMLVARLLSDDATVIALTGLAAFLGHLFPVFFGFNGGKGVATAGGVFIGLNLALSGLLVLMWLVVAVVFRYSSLAALVTAAATPFIVSRVLPEPAYVAMSAVIAALLYWRHCENIRRLLKGEEGKIRLKRED